MVEVHPELKRFVRNGFLRYRGVSRLSGYQILRRVALGGEVIWGMDGKVYIDVGRIWGTREAEKYVKRLKKLLKVLDAKLEYAAHEGVWLMVVEKERAAMALTLYKGWVFNHEFCLHKRSRKVDRDCVKGLVPSW